MPRPESKTLSEVEQDLEVKTEDKRSAKKDYEVTLLPEGLFHIRFSAGGEVPDILKGRWTSIARAQTAIDSYKNSLVEAA